jgi:putative heme-binding domain-containing protein
MRRPIVVAGFNALLVAAAAFLAVPLPHAVAQDLVAKTEHLTPDEEHKAFKLPPGFEIQLVAAEQDINKPMNLAFDAKGRLWVTSTTDYPYPVLEGKGHDKVLILSDFDEKGHAQKIETFYEGLTIPIGILPIEHGCLVFGVDYIRKLIDTDGDDKADKEEKFMGTIGHRDTHGLTSHFTVGFDGWVYANHGFNNDSEMKAKDGSSIKMNSGNCYRFTLDGEHVQYVAHGQVNPFGLCFDPRGDLFSADCHTRPQMMLLRGGYYQSFGKPDDGLGFAPEMCDHDHGSTAIAGTVFYDDDKWPEKYRGTLFDGNPVTTKINHDRIEWHGSSPIAKEQPDFLTSTDPWFRPVDIVLGPDGAMYVADFYNRIIGHYEVPLDHPGRDRKSGRIWRIVYRGEDGKLEIPKAPDLAAASPQELGKTLGAANMALRMMAARQLVERVGTSSADVVKEAAQRPENANQHVMALWVLHRLNALPNEGIAVAAADSDGVVRTHAMRILSEMPKVSEEQFELLRKGLADSDPFVRRAAADAMGQHPNLGNVRPLIAARNAAAKDDTHLIYVIRMALRNQLEHKDIIVGIPELKLTDDEQRALADVITGVASPDVGTLLISFIKKGITDPEKTVQLLIRAAKSIPVSDVDALTQTVLERFPGKIDIQRQLFVALLEGLAQRGAQPGEAARKWGTDLAHELAKTPKLDANAWHFMPFPGSNDATDPWAPEMRGVGTKHPAELWSSHPRGEKLMGILRSKPFAIPKKLSFVVAGHYGMPPSNELSKNFVRLKLVDGDEVIEEVPPPRTDTPRAVKWELAKWAGQQGYLEAVDGDNRDAWAWIAFGQFKPEVAPTPTTVERIRDRLVAASVITRALKLAELRGRMEEVLKDPNTDATARAGAARALGTVGTPESVKVLAAVAIDPNVAPPVRDAVAQSLAEQNSPESREALLAAIHIAPEPLQRTIAVSLVATKDGAEALLAAVKDGKASPRLLQDPSVLERLRAAGVADVDKRITDLTKGLIPADEAIRKLVEERRKTLNLAKASADRGAQVFEKNCAICHRIGEVGAVIGPQLTGVGKRGAERIIEDVLDPNRNVDGAFRTTILQLKTGDTVSGLLRREEGELIVLADSTGKENSYDKGKVKRRVTSALSLMPSNFGETIKPDEFTDLVAFLLSK